MYNLGEFQKLFIKRFKNNGAYIGLKEIKNEKNFIGKIVYSFDDGELITEYTEIIVW